jgi:hypothetical protein
LISKRRWCLISSARGDRGGLLHWWTGKHVYYQDQHLVLLRDLPAGLVSFFPPLEPGHITNLALTSGTRYILRKKPTGTIISPVAHQVDREFRVLKALGSVEGFPVPEVYTLCMDPKVIGTAFYVSIKLDSSKVAPSKNIVLMDQQVMEFVKGRIITDPDLGELSPSDRREA